MKVTDVQVCCLLPAVVCLYVQHHTEEQLVQTECADGQLTEQPLGGAVVTLVTVSQTQVRCKSSV